MEVSMTGEVTGIFQFSVGAGVGVPNIIANTAFDFVTKDSMMKVKANLNAASAGATISITITDQNRPTQPYPPAAIPTAASGAGTITEFDPWITMFRVSRGSRVVIAIANPAAAAGQVWVGLQ